MNITLELFAVAVGVEGNAGIGQVSHHLEIVTETDVLHLPVIASIFSIEISLDEGLYSLLFLLFPACQFLEIFSTARDLLRTIRLLTFTKFQF